MIENIKTNKRMYIIGVIILSLISTVALAANDNKDNKRRICHLQNNGSFEEQYLNANSWNGHNDHEGDLWDVAPGECPKDDPREVGVEPNENANDSSGNKRRICHMQNNGSYEEQYLNANSWNGHNDHENDLWDVKPGECPA